MSNSEKLHSLIEAIDLESRQPSPSHSNLARLVSLFFTELISTEVIQEVKTQTAVAVPPPPVEYQEPEIQEPVEEYHEKQSESKRPRNKVLSGHRPRKVN